MIINSFTKEFQAITSERDFEDALYSANDNNKLALVCFLVAWDGNIKRVLIPKLNELYEKYHERVEFFEIDMDGDGLKKLIHICEVQLAPTLLLFKGKEVVAKQLSVKPPEEWLKSHLERLGF